ncbi:SpvB/TcaC N-terminal domain-containing protein [Streptomyces sp. NPDC051546]|uniref:SpvB/TcaC N-terminal domain-containing protein n=1 Tax=Streptomyces sp. NPDC051546 TaxID=3365655 RepID=UPI00378A4BC0
MEIPLAHQTQGSGPALVHAPGAGNSAFGVDWDLPLAAITRVAGDRAPLYTDEDTFTLAGSGPLTLAPGTAALPAPRPGGDEVTAVVRYTTTDGTGTVADRCTTTGGTFWLVRRTDGTTLLLGRSPGTRISDPADDARVWSWLLEDAVTFNGERTHHHWEPGHTTVGSGARPRLREVLSSPVHPQAHHPLDIPATDHQAPAWRDAYLDAVVFDYGDHTEDNTTFTPDQDPAPRPDAFTISDGGFDLTTRYLCRRILSLYREAGAAWAPHAILRLRYDGDPSGVRLTGVDAVAYTHDRLGASVDFGCQETS